MGVPPMENAFGSAKQTRSGDRKSDLTNFSTGLFVSFTLQVNTTATTGYHAAGIDTGH